MIASKYPSGAVDAMTNKHHLKLKVKGTMSYHLGFDIGRNGDGALHFAPRKYIENMEEC